MVSSPSAKKKKKRKLKVTWDKAHLRLTFMKMKLLWRAPKKHVVVILVFYLNDINRKILNKAYNEF